MQTISRSLSLTSFRDKQILKGCYMAGVIDSDVPKCTCGGSWKKQAFGKYEVPVCSQCNKHPPKIRIRRVLPGEYGEKAKRLEIRQDKNGNKLTDVMEAILVMREIDEQIKSNTFDPRNYGSRESIARFKFSNFVEKNYLPDCERRESIGELSKAMLINKRGLYKNHLKPFFKDTDLRNIGPAMINGFYKSFTKTLRQRELATAELKVILNAAIDYELITGVPKFPKLKKAKFRDVETFYTSEQQDMVVSMIENHTYRIAIRLLVKYAMRPGEVRALREKDVDVFNDKLTIAQHFSKNKLTPGRKSNGNAHYLHLDEEAKEFLSGFLTGNPDAPLFKGAEGGYMSEKVLQVAWNRAVSKTPLTHIDLYTGTKHSTVTQKVREGHSDREIMNLTGHETLAAFKRYGQQTENDKMKDQKNVLQLKRKAVNE